MPMPMGIRLHLWWQSLIKGLSAWPWGPLCDGGEQQSPPHPKSNQHQCLFPAFCFSPSSLLENPSPLSFLAASLSSFSSPSPPAPSIHPHPAICLVLLLPGNCWDFISSPGRGARGPQPPGSPVWDAQGGAFRFLSLCRWQEGDWGHFGHLGLLIHESASPRG